MIPDCFILRPHERTALLGLAAALFGLLWLVLATLPTDEWECASRNSETLQCERVYR